MEAVARVLDLYDRISNKPQKSLNAYGQDGARAEPTPPAVIARNMAHQQSRYSHGYMNVNVAVVLVPP
jgi:hypothetical protein